MPRDNPLAGTFARMLFARWLLLFSCLALGCHAQPAQPAAPPEVTRLLAHLTYLTTTPQPRNAEHVAVLDSVAAYIQAQLRAAGARVTEQPYVADGHTYRNVIGSFGPETGPRIVVGAHYDVCGDQPGADDNGSGVAALLELAQRLGQERQLPGRLDLVAYTLEEPPYFNTEQMGSFVHARSLREQRVEVLGMVALEMLGYYDEREGSQSYPLPAMAQHYGTRGNFTAVVQQNDGGAWAQQFARRFGEAAYLPVQHYHGPAGLPGVSFSDHASYWRQGFPALMLTDTSFYRNKRYHKATDTPDTLDYDRIALVTDAVLAVLRQG